MSSTQQADAGSTSSASRDRRFDSFFSHSFSHSSGNNTTTDKNLQLKLEKSKLMENKVWLDKKMLEHYRGKNLIPRGLRLKKFPNTMYEGEFIKKWEAILSECSDKLMELIIHEEEKRLAQLQDDIENIETLLAESITLEALQTLNENINKKVLEAEKKMSEIKRNKLRRDENDYDKGEVYSWRVSRRIHRNASSNKRNNRNRHQYNISREDYTSMSSSNSDTSVSSVDNHDLRGAKAQRPNPRIVSNVNLGARSKNAEDRDGNIDINPKHYYTRQNRKI